MQKSAEPATGKAPTRRPSDRELLSRFLAERDESAFAELVTRYSRLVMSVALHTLRDPHAAEDAFQATFLVLAKSARRIRNRDSLASWLHGTTFRVSHRLLRTRLRRKEQDLPNVEPAAPWDPPARPDEQAALDEELARLSEGLRGPLVLHYLEGRTVPEIAAELKMTPACVEGRLKRGKQTLRKRLLKRGVLLSSAVFGAGFTIPAEAGVAATLVTATVAACLGTTATATLAPIAATTVQHIALQEMAAMTRIALLKTALVCCGAAGALGLAGAAGSGTLQQLWASTERTAAVAETGLVDETDDSDLAPNFLQTTVQPAVAHSPPVQLNGSQTIGTAEAIVLDVAPSQDSPEKLKPSDPATRVDSVTIEDVVQVSKQDLATRDKRIRELEDMVRATQVQVENLRVELAREKRKGSRPSSTPPAGMPGGIPGTAPVPTADSSNPELHAVAGKASPFGTAPRLNLQGRDSWPSKTITGLTGSGSSAGPSTALPREFRPASPNEERIRNALAQNVDFQFTGQTLEEVVNYLASSNNISIRLDKPALTEAGVGPDQEINFVMSGVSLAAALNLIFKDVSGTQLDYIIEDEVMTVTTREKADATLQTIIYDISGLGSIDAEQLRMILEKTVEPNSWEQAGGQGTIVPVDNSVIITTSRRLHDKTAKILHMLQQHATATRQ